MQQPVGGLQIRQEPIGVLNPGRAHLLHLPQALPHHMDIVNVQEDQLDAGVVFFTFVAATFGAIGHRVGQRSGIHDAESRTDRIGVVDHFDVALILFTVTLHAYLEKEPILSKKDQGTQWWCRVNQSINQSINQSMTNQSINQSNATSVVRWSINQWIDRPSAL